ncbi:DUF4864 domain-containing protein [Pontibacter sp. SGAir0037]|uniref:DUF4864 domain-containing protein n=1 Tax=Pontibacter sp. SGAir0037 TaxID=2571030 RepID=UPI0010CCD00D|nr:DUF4864 domain-containing protein [Pontibacter sp. SGAir0037]QCR24234.1 hypothetical protein C1N53_18990 [Pontibacter sp. SGAir0037]
MRGFENILDKLLIGVGVLLLAMVWMLVPSKPYQDVQHYAVYRGAEAETGSTSKWSYVQPSKTLTPRDVINIQLKALQQNDRSDSGIITVFNFSSPMSRVQLGPVNHFRLLVREPAYRPMLNFKSSKKGKLIITDDTAYQLVVVTDKDGDETAYLFILAKQNRGMFKDCWMTEGVTRLEPERESSMI